MGTVSELSKKRFEYLELLVEVYCKGDDAEKEKIHDEIERFLPSEEEISALAEKLYKKIDTKAALPLSKGLYDALIVLEEREKREKAEKEEREKREKEEQEKREKEEQEKARLEELEKERKELEKERKERERKRIESEKEELEPTFENFYTDIMYARERRDDIPEEMLKEIQRLTGDEMSYFGEFMCKIFPRETSYDDLQCLSQPNAEILIYLMKELKSKEFIDGVFKNREIFLDTLFYHSWEEDSNSSDWMRSCFISYSSHYDELDGEEEWATLQCPYYEFADKFKSSKPGIVANFIIREFDYKHIFMVAGFKNYEDKDFFTLGYEFGQWLRVNKNERIADITKFLTKELESEAFTEGLSAEDGFYHLTDLEKQELIEKEEQELLEEREKERKKLEKERKYQLLKKIDLAILSDNKYKSAEERFEMLSEIYILNGDDLRNLGHWIRSNLPKTWSSDNPQSLPTQYVESLIYYMKKLKSKEFIDGLFENGEILLETESHSWESDYNSSDWMRSCFFYYNSGESYPYTRKRASLRCPYNSFADKFISAEPEKVVSFILENFYYRHIFMVDGFKKYEDKDFFTLGKLFRDKFYETREVSEKIAVALICLMQEIGSNEFIDGVFSNGKIYLGCNVDDDIIKSSKFSKSEGEYWSLINPTR